MMRVWTVALLAVFGSDLSATSFILYQGSIAQTATRVE